MTRKTILVTGATSGFGKLTVQLLLQRGHRVIAGVRGGEARLNPIFAAELASLPPGSLRALDLHLDRPETFGAVSELLEKKYGGKLDVLINNAGFVLLGPFETQSAGEIRKQFDVNFFGPLELTRAVLPALKRARGRVLNVSSGLGLFMVPYYATYAATKHALEAQTEGLYYDLKPFGVQVGLIQPGSFRTELVASSVIGDAARLPTSPYYQPMKTVEGFLNDNIGLAGNPRRVARLLVRRSEQRSVPIRTLIGPDAWLLLALKRALPERVRVALLEWFFRVLVARLPRLPSPAPAVDHQRTTNL